MRPEDAAQIILNGNWDLSLPVNPVDIAQKLGLQVYYGSDMENLAGYFDQEKNSIYINETDTLSRQRFSIAHEIGHAVLGHGSSPRRNDVTYSKFTYKKKENEANRFATSLLMPEVAVRTCIEQSNMKFPELCKTFGVSERAMGIRLVELGYLR